MSRLAVVIAVLALAAAPALAESYYWGEIGEGGIVWIDGWGDWGEVGFWYEDYYVDIYGVGEDMLYIEENGDIWADGWLFGYINPYGDVYSDAEGYLFTIEYDPAYDDFSYDGVYAYDAQTVFFVLAFEQKFYGYDAGLEDVFVYNQPPDALIRWDKVSGSWDEVSFYADVLDLDGRIESVEWDFGDGSWTDEWDPTHAYGRSGWYQVTLTCWDDGGESDWTSIDIYIESRPPKANFKRTVLYSTPGLVQFYDKSKDKNGAIVKWAWDFGDGEYSAERNPMHVYANPGTYWVTLKVTDDDGEIDTRQATVNVKFKTPH